jgi:hypothetical protein
MSSPLRLARKFCRLGRASDCPGLGLLFVGIASSQREYQQVVRYHRKPEKKTGGITDSVPANVKRMADCDGEHNSVSGTKYRKGDESTQAQGAPLPVHADSNDCGKKNTLQPKSVPSQIAG